MDTLNFGIFSESFSADIDGPVLDDSAFRVGCANTRSLETRIDAALFDTSLSSLTIRIDFTFGFNNRFDDGRSRSTIDKWIANKAGSTGANRIMADDLTLSVGTASARTRIFAFCRDTGHVVRWS